MSAPASAPVRGRTWARGFGVSLVQVEMPVDDLEAVFEPATLRGLRDGIERGYDGPLPPPPEDVRLLSIRAGDEEVGALAVLEGSPEERAATFFAVAIAPDRRGRAFGARTLLAAERRLRREGVRAFYARVPRTNGRGLYFMLRCGYAPLLRPPPLEGGGTWFRHFEAGDALEPGR